MKKLIDAYGRKHDYLRIGVTDRCNLRCRYCMPEEGISFLDRQDLLSYEELEILIKVFSEMGVTKVRLTGGEPFVRKDLPQLLEYLTKWIPSIHITSNATLIGPYIHLLKEMGISGINVSLDTLQKEVFQVITRRDKYDVVIDNIERMISHDIPVKINVVAMNGINTGEIPQFIEWGRNLGVHVRFIEAMPFNEGDGNRSQFISASEIKSIIEEYYSLKPIKSGVAQSSLEYEMEDGYTIGIIPSYSRSLCNFCNRIRLTPKGELLTCLYATEGISLRDLLRSGCSELQLKEAIFSAIVGKKKDGYEEEKSRTAVGFESMTTIGG